MEFPGGLVIKQQTSGNPFAQCLVGLGGEFCGEGSPNRGGDRQEMAACGLLR
jgi:hypothetical protein